MSDFHLGYNEDSFEQARNALISAKKQADVILIAGDLFDERIPTPETIHKAISIFKEVHEDFNPPIEIENLDNSFLEVKKPILVIYGNHERRSKNLVDIIRLLEKANMFINVHMRKLMLKKEDEKICVQGVGGVPQIYAKRVFERINLTPVKGCFNILMFHQDLKELMPFSDNILSIADLPGGFDLYIDGHIHWKREIIEGGKRIILPGSTVVTQMKKNEMEPKGYWLFDTKTKKTEFNTIKTRPFYLIEIKVNEASSDEILKRMKEELRKVGSSEEKKPQVKLKISGTLKPGLRSSDISLESVAAEFPNILLSVSKEFRSEDLKQKIEMLRKLRNEKRSVKEAGMEVLKQRLEENQFKLGNEEELFDLVVEGKSEEIIKKLLS